MHAHTHVKQAPHITCVSSSLRPKKIKTFDLIATTFVYINGKMVNTVV